MKCNWKIAALVTRLQNCVVSNACCRDLFEGTIPWYPMAYLLNFIDKSTIYVYLN
jgi:hypothetical protein